MYEAKKYIQYIQILGPSSTAAFGNSVWVPDCFRWVCSRPTCRCSGFNPGHFCLQCMCYILNAGRFKRLLSDQSSNTHRGLNWTVRRYSTPRFHNYMVQEQCTGWESCACSTQRTGWVGGCLTIFWTLNVLDTTYEYVSKFFSRVQVFEICLKNESRDSWDVRFHAILIAHTKILRTHGIHNFQISS